MIIFVEWLKSVFSFNNKKQERLELSSDSSGVMKDRSNQIIDRSQEYIKKINNIEELVSDTIYHEKLKKISELTKMIHDKILEEKVPIERLEQFHMYYTDNFIETYSDIFSELMPKKDIDEKLKSEHVLTDSKYYYGGIKKMSIKTRVELLLKSINSNYELIQYKEFDDVVEIGKKQENVTYADKYTTYLIKQWNLKDSIKFVGELNQNETPVIYDTITLEVFLIRFNSKIPEKIGSVAVEDLLLVLNK